MSTEESRIHVMRAWLLEEKAQHDDRDFPIIWKRGVQGDWWPHIAEQDTNLLKSDDFIRDLLLEKTKRDNKKGN